MLSMSTFLYGLLGLFKVIEAEGVRVGNIMCFPPRRLSHWPTLPTDWFHQPHLILPRETIEQSTRSNPQQQPAVRVRPAHLQRSPSRSRTDLNTLPLRLRSSSST